MEGSGRGSSCRQGTAELGSVPGSAGQPAGAQKGDSDRADQPPPPSPTGQEHRAAQDGWRGPLGTRTPGLKREAACRLLPAGLRSHWPPSSAVPRPWLRTRSARRARCGHNTGGGGLGPASRYLLPRPAGPSPDGDPDPAPAPAQPAHPQPADGLAVLPPQQRQLLPQLQDTTHRAGAGTVAPGPARSRAGHRTFSFWAPLRASPPAAAASPGPSAAAVPSMAAGPSIAASRGKRVSMATGPP